MTIPYGALGQGIGTFQSARDPVNQARELEIFMRLQREQFNSLRSQLESLSQPDQSVMDAGISVGPIQMVPTMAQGQQNADTIRAAGQAPQPNPIAGRPELYDGLDGTDDQLIQRAKALGVDNAEQIPREALKQIIIARRQDIRPEENVGVLRNIGPAVGLMGIEAAQGLTDIAKHAIRFVNEGLGRYAMPNAPPGAGLFSAINDREMEKEHISGWLAGLDEGVRATIGPDDNRYGGIMGGVGNLLAYGGIGSAIFQGLGLVTDAGGAVFPAIGRLASSPMARGAVQGLGTALTLDAGTDKPWLPSADDLGKLFAGETSIGGRAEAALALTFRNRLMNSTLGGLLGGLGEHYAKKFVPGRTQVHSANADIAAEAESRAAAGNIEDADWHFIDENGGLQSGTTPARRLGPGGDPSGNGAGGAPTSPNGAPPTPLGLRELTTQEASTATTRVNGAPQTAQDIHPWMRSGWLSQDASELSGPHPSGPPGVRVEPMAPGSDPSIVRVVARDASGNPIGALTLSKTGSNSADALTVFVEPSARGQGVATSLYNEAERAGIQVRSGAAGYTDEGLGFADRRAIRAGQPPAAAQNGNGYIGPERQLMAPLNREGQSLINQYTAARNLGMGPAGSSLDSWIGQIRSDRSRWVTRTRDEAVADLWPLREQYANLSARSTFLAQQGTDVQAFGDIQRELQTLDEQIYATLTSADMTRKDPLPTLNDKMKENPLSPATPSRDLVNQVGTIFRTPNGHPKLMFHGSAVPYADIDPAKLAAGDNLLGPAFYASDNPLIAGGDPLDVTGEDGYARARAASLQAERANLQIGLSDLNRAIEAFETNGPASGVSPEAYQAAIKSRDATQVRLNSIPQPAPNVRPFFVTGKNFLNVDAPMSMEDGLRIIRQFSEHPATADFDINGVAKAWQQMGQSFVPGQTQYGRAAQPTGKTLYDLLTGMEATTPTTGNGWDQVEGTFGDSRVNEVFRDSGYDGFVYDGGVRTGTALGQHQAVAVFDPKNIVPAYISGEVLEEHAARLGVQMQKMHEVMDSPLTPELSTHSEITDADVAAAQAANNPGGFNLIRNISDPKTTLEQLGKYVFDGSFGGLIKAYRIVVAPSGDLDLLVSSLGEITDDVVADYQRTGLFRGMEVVDKKSGKIKTVINIGEKTAEVQSEAQARRGPKFTNWADVDRLAPNPNAKHIIDAPDLYERFKLQTMNNLSLLKFQANQGPVTEWIDPIVYQNLSKQFDHFADSIGMTDPGAKAALYRYFDQRYVQDVQALDQDLSDMVQAQDQAIDAAAMESDEPPDLHSMAGMKGYILTTNQNGSFVLHDQLSMEKLPMANEAAVEVFLTAASSDRVPNMTPASEVTPDAVPQYHDGEMHAEPNEEQEADQLIEDILGEEDEVADEAAAAHTALRQPPAGAGGGGAGQPPSVPPTGNAGPPQPPQGPFGGVPNAKLKAMRRAALRRQLDQEGVYTLQHRYERQLFGRYFSPMRVHFANLENDLHQAGVRDLRPSQQFERIIAGMDIAHNETFPYLEESGNIFKKVARRKLRDGSWARMWLIEDRVDRALIAKRNGFSMPEIRAMGELDNIIIKMHVDHKEDGIGMLNQLKKFVAEARTNHEQGKFGPTSYPVANYPTIGFYGEKAVDMRSRFEKVNPNRLIQSYIKAWGFYRNVGKVWNETAEQWRMVRGIQVEGEPRFTQLADHMLDWMDFVKRGPEPGKELSVKVVNRILRMFGVPLTQTETRSLMQGMQRSMYDALLGWRLHVVIRDSSQPMLAGPTVGFDNLTSAYKTAAMLRSNAREEMKQRAYDYGVTQHRLPRIEGTGVFESETPADRSEFGAVQRGIRTAGAAVGDVLRDLTPRVLRRSDLSLFGPMGLYTREGEWNRIIVGEAARLNFLSKHNEWLMNRRIAATMNNPALIPSVDEFMSNINADSLRPAILRQIKDQVEQGNIDGPHGAMAIYMRAVANRTQFTYGGRHAPAAIRTTGARIGYALGNFSSQSIALGKEAIAYGKNSHKFKFLATVAGVTGALELLHRTTGFNFRSFEWWQSLLFTGSPMLRQMVDLVQTANAARDVLTSDNPSQESVSDLSSIRPEDTIANLMRMYNPLQGAAYTIGGAARALESPTPATALARLFLTGDTRGGASDFNRILSNPVPPGQTPPAPQQTTRQAYPQVRLPGANMHHGQDTTLQGALIQDMIRIQRGYQPNYQPPVPPAGAAPDSGMGGGQGAF